MLANYLQAITATADARERARAIVDASNRDCDYVDRFASTSLTAKSSLTAK